MKNLFLLVGYLFLLTSVCSAQDLGELRRWRLINDEQKQRLERLKLGELRLGKQECQRGFFVLYKKNENDEWILSSISRSKSKLASPGKEELLVFSDDLKCVMPGYDEKPDPGESKSFLYLCDKGLLSKRGDIYNPCTSSLYVTSVSAGSLLGQAVALPLMAIIGTVVYHVAPDLSKFIELVEKTGTIEKLELERYRWKFMSATNLRDYENFVAEYSDIDPDGLVVQAKEKIVEIKKFIAERERAEREKFLAAYRNNFLTAKSIWDYRNFVSRYSSDDPDGLVSKAKEIIVKLEKEEEEQRAKAKHRELSRIDAFRNGLKVESETNCGPVLEIKGGLVRIYAPVQGYGNEHWIKKDLLFPPGYSCRFVNGHYQPPAFEW